MVNEFGDTPFNNSPDGHAQRPRSLPAHSREKFNELDNWIEVMECDPPKTYADKIGMYNRLAEIIDGYPLPSPSDSASAGVKIENLAEKSHRRIIYEEFRKIITK